MSKQGVEDGMVMSCSEAYQSKTFDYAVIRISSDLRPSNQDTVEVISVNYDQRIHTFVDTVFMTAYTLPITKGHL